MSESSFYYIPKSGKFISLPTVEEALEKVKTGGFVWLSYYQPVYEDLNKLMEPLGLHPLSIEDCLDDEQIPKIENFPTNTFILFNAFAYVEKKLTIEEVDLFVGDNFLVTVNREYVNQLKLLDSIERIIRTDKYGAHLGPAFILHVILDQIVDHKFLAIDKLEDELDKEEDQIMNNVTEFNPAKLQLLRRDLLLLRKCLFHEREIFVKICRKDCPFIAEKSIPHYRDIYDHMTKFFELIETCRENVTSLMDLYLNLMNTHMAKSGHQMNNTVRRLTFITTIFMPLTLLAGIGGMSEWSMMTGPENWKVSYALFLLLMGAIGMVNYYILKWQDKQSDDKSKHSI